MATNQMHNLTTLVKRLEAATSRLEDIASSAFELPQAVPGLHPPATSPPQPSPSSTLSAPPPAPAPAASAPPAAPSAPPPPPAPVTEPVPESIEEFDSLINQSVANWAKLSNAIGGLVAEQAAEVVKAFKEQRKFLLITTKAKKPDMGGAGMSALQDLLKPISDLMTAVAKIKDSNRGSPLYNNLCTVSEGMIALAWVTMDAKPFKQVEEGLASAQFWGNKILAANKNKDAEQVEWVKAYFQILRDLTEYAKTYFPHGIPWNPKGLPPAEAAKAVAGVPSPAAPPAPSAGGPPPPPPPPPGPPPVLKINEQKAVATPAGGLGAVFSELNKGEAVTKGLRKVDKSEMTHKNPSLRAGSTVPDGGAATRGKSPAPGKKPKPESMRVKKPPKKELEGNKWTVENYDKPSEPVELEVSMSHSILISKCNNTTIILKGKANAVTVENSNRLSLVVESLVSTVDVVKSQNFALQVMGTIPTVLMDQIDGAQIYLSKESSSTRIFSSKSSGINLNVIAGPDDDYKELPLASQICSYFDEEKGDVVNEIVSHAG